MRFILFPFLLFCSTIIAQQKTKLTIPKSASTHVNVITQDWNPVLQNYEMPKPGTATARGKLLQLKEENAAKYPRKEKFKPSPSKSNLSSPEVLRNFQGNVFMNRFPNDNDIAISNAGQLISVINSNLYIFDTNLDSLLKNISFDAFAESLELPDFKYDPRVIYDPNKDRFIAVILNGFLDSTSQVIVAFSATNDATGEWNLYALPGNPQNNGTWSDYPTIGISASELFITLNTFTNGSVNNSGFTETVIWQINLENGYEGNDLNTAYYTHILPEGKSAIFNLCPVRGGSAIEGDDMYLLSNKNLSTQNDTFFLLKVDGQIPDATLTVDILRSKNQYFLPPSAKQAANRTFDTNDSRILFAFRENGKIQFVQSCLDTLSGNAGVYHGLVNNYENEPSIRANTLSDTLDLGFPGISYIGNGTNDDRAIINVNHSSANVFSGCSVYSFDGASNYSERVEVKAGDNYVTTNQFGAYQRWGDYTGTQRKYNEEGIVWVTGSYGTNNRRNGTWITEINWDDDTFLSVNENNKAKVSNIVYPNPSDDEVNVQFNIDKAESLRFSLYDMQGKLVKQLLREFTKKGENLFSFSMQPLPAGVYILSIESSDSIIHQQKLIKN